MERDEEKQLMKQYTRPPPSSKGSFNSTSGTGFVVRDAPWSGPSAEEFPTLGGKPNPPATQNDAEPPPPVASPQKSWKPKWGPSSLGPRIPK